MFKDFHLSHLMQKFKQQCNNRNLSSSATTGVGNAFCIVSGIVVACKSFVLSNLVLIYHIVCSFLFCFLGNTFLHMKAMYLLLRQFVFLTVLTICFFDTHASSESFNS